MRERLRGAAFLLLLLLSLLLPLRGRVPLPARAKSGRWGKAGEVAEAELRAAD